MSLLKSELQNVDLNFMILTVSVGSFHKGSSIALIVTSISPIHQMLKSPTRLHFYLLA